MLPYQNEHFILSVESHLHLIHLTWLGVPSSENYYKGNLMALKLAKRHQVKRWLIDQQKLKMFNPRDLQWHIQEWLPEAARRLNTKPKVAIVLTNVNQFAKLGTDMILRAAFDKNPALESRYCLGQEEARRWLMGIFAETSSHVTT